MTLLRWGVWASSCCREDSLLGGLWLPRDARGVTRGQGSVAARRGRGCSGYNSCTFWHPPDFPFLLTVCCQNSPDSCELA